MLRTNEHALVIKAVMGHVSPPKMVLKNPYIVSSSGKAVILPGTGGITYNVLVGDNGFSFEGDHIEPCVSILADDKSPDTVIQGALSVLSCIGNEAYVVSGHASGSRGVVTGKHGGVEHILCDFPQSTLQKLSIGDRIQIKAWGQGLELKDFPDIMIMNISPDLFKRLGITRNRGRLIVPVTHVIPASIMGSGYGSRHSFSGDIDIQVPDKEAMKKHGLQELRIGDIVAIRDLDGRFGRVVRDRAISIGVVVHASCLVSGHGPGVTLIMSADDEKIVPRITEEANIGIIMGIGRFRRGSSYRRKQR